MELEVLSPQPATPRAAESVPSLEMQGLTKRFHQGTSAVVALEQFSLTAEPGEFIAVMGNSGSGKSTLLNLIAGLTRPDAGTVRIDGEPISAMRDPRLTRFRRCKIGLVFQAFNLIPTLSAFDNVRLPVLAGAPQGPLGADQLLRLVGLEHRSSHRPDALSGGEQQRVAIARALISQPSLLLADEPTGSLDSVTGQSICRLLKELHRDTGRTVVVVTHEPEVARWADRVVVLRDGRKLTEFPTDSLQDAGALAARYRDIVSGASEKGDAT